MITQVSNNKKHRHTGTTNDGGAVNSDWIDINSINSNGQTVNYLQTIARPNDTAYAGSGSEWWSKGYLRFWIPNHKHGFTTDDIGIEETRTENLTYKLWKRIN